MGGWKKGAALAALVGILAGPAIAQTVGDGAKTPTTGTKIAGIKADDTTGVILRLDSDGRPTVVAAERYASPLGNLVLIQNNAITTSARADSMTIPIAVSQYRSAYLTLTGYPDSLTTVARFAVQIRGHSTAAVDTGSTYKWFPWHRSVPATFTAGAVDSLGDFVLASASVVSADEFTWIVSSKPALPRGIMIPLFGPDSGAEFRPPYLSVRVRLINLEGGAGLSRVKVRVGLVAVPY